MHGASRIHQAEHIRHGHGKGEISEEDVERIRREVDSIGEKDTSNPNKVVHVASRTPFVFRSLSLPDLEVVMYASKLAKGIYLGPDQRHGHSNQIDHDVAKNVLVRFPDPLYVFSSKTDKERSLVAVYDVMDKSGDNPIMASIRKNVERDRIEINLVTGLYAKASQVYQSWVDTGLLLYVDDTRKNLPQSVRLQLPTEVEGSNYKLLRKSQLVNGGNGESYPTFFETSEDEADTPLYELTDEQRKEFTNKWARDVELGVRAHEPVTNQVLKLFKGQDWADSPEDFNFVLENSKIRWKFHLHHQCWNLPHFAVK